MSFAVLICTYGTQDWVELAHARAEPSARGQGAEEIICNHDPEGTLASSRNRAARRARNADWLCFLDADDELAPGYLRAMSAAIGRQMVEGIGHYQRILYAPLVSYLTEPDEAGRVSVGFPHIPNEGRWPAYNECVIGTVVNREVFKEVGGFRELPSLEDYDLFLRCRIAGASILHVQDAIYRAYITAGSRNSDQSVYDRIVADNAEAFR